MDWAKIPRRQFDQTVVARESYGHSVFVRLDGEEEMTQFVARHGHVLDAQGWLPGGQVRDERMYASPR